MEKVQFETPIQQFNDVPIGQESAWDDHEDKVNTVGDVIVYMMEMSWFIRWRCHSLYDRDVIVYMTKISLLYHGCIIVRCR